MYSKPFIFVLISILTIALVYSSISASGVFATGRGAAAPPQAAACYPYCGVYQPPKHTSHTHPATSATSGAPDDESGSPTTGQSILPGVLQQQQQPPPADQGAAAPRIAEPPPIEDDVSQPQAVDDGSDDGTDDGSGGDDDGDTSGGDR